MSQTHTDLHILQVYYSRSCGSTQWFWFVRQVPVFRRQHDSLAECKLHQEEEEEEEEEWKAWSFYPKK